MKLTDILDCELKHVNTNNHIIYFYKSGDWWRAYEWSAYLCHLYSKNKQDCKKLNLIHKKENEMEYVFVGLQLSSFDKYFPNIDKGNDVNMIDGETLVVNIDKYLTDVGNIQNADKTMKEWKETIPIKEEKKSKCSPKTPLVHDFEGKEIPNPSVMGIIQEIMVYPLEDKTLVDNVSFIRKIKNEITRLFIINK